MAVNKSKGNMFKEFDTWNVVKGECYHNCSYCYCKKIAKRFNKVQKPVRFDEKELKTNLGSGNSIFVGSSCDMFSDNIPSAWILRVLEHCRKYDNKYLFQTKNPKKLLNYLDEIPKNSVIGTTIESDMDYDDIMGNSPFVKLRAIHMYDISYSFETQITIEPILKFNLSEIVKMIKLTNASVCYIGADSGKNNLPEPSKEEILELIKELSIFTTVKLKSNLNRIIK